MDGATEGNVMKGVYRVYVWCRNCGMRDHIAITQGTPIEHQRCPRCRCCELSRHG